MRRTLAAAAALMMLGTGAAVAQNLNPVTDARLQNPEPHNWLQWRGNYEGWGYSPLDEITTENVKNLRPVWTFATGVTEGHQAPPMVNDGVMYVSTPQNQVFALDAVTGNEIWRYLHEIPGDLFQLHPTNRGVGLYGDKVYMATVDARMVALDAKTGNVVWNSPIGDYKAGYYATLSPLVAEGKVVVGVSGGEYGIRGYVIAFDSETGAEAWRTHTVPGPGEPGHDTWKGDSWKTGGGSVWMQGNYDADAKLAYFGTGNGGPWIPEARPGDNLYTTSVIALDINTGEIKGHHQYHWNDAWDWDEVSAPVLMDFERDGRKVKGLVHAGRNGFIWSMERTDEGPINFVAADKYVRQNAFTSIDPETGRPSYNESATPGLNRVVTFCPSLWGGKDWPMEAYSPRTGLLYIPSHENLCSELGGSGEIEDYEPGQLYIGIPIDVILSSLRIHESQDTSKPVTIGKLQAWDMNTGKMVWATDFKDTPFWAPLLATGGDLIFTGGTVDRKFRAMDARNGEILWEHPMPSGVTATPASFAVDGKQYIAVQSGWGVDAERMRGLLASILPEGRVPTVPQGGSIHVFAVD